MWTPAKRTEQVISFSNSPLPAISAKMPIDQSQVLTVRIKDEGNDVKMELKMEEGEIQGYATALGSPTSRAHFSTTKRSRRSDQRRRRSSSTSQSREASSSLHSHRIRTSSSTISGQQNSHRPHLPSSPHLPSPARLSSLPRSPSPDRPKSFIDSHYPCGNAYAPGDTPARRGVPESDRWRPAGYGRTPRQRGVQQSDFYRPAPREEIQIKKGSLSWAEMAAQITASEPAPPTKSISQTKPVPPANSNTPKKPRSGLFAYEDGESSMEV